MNGWQWAESAPCVPETMGSVWGRGAGEEAVPHPSFRSGAGDTETEAGKGPSARKELLRIRVLPGPRGRAEV